jgi:hypothetical protein
MRAHLATEHPPVALLGLTTAATVLACLATPALAPVAIVIPASPAPVVPAPRPPAKPASPTPASPRAGELLFALRAGDATYVRLAAVENGDQPGLAVPRHGPLRHVTDEGVELAIASVALADVPADYAVWKDRTLKVDGHCEAKVTGFAVVARLTGDPAYTDAEPRVEAWDAELVMRHGARALAVRLDGCTGAYARDAALPDPVVAEVLHDAELEAAGRAALIASPLSAETQGDWDAAAKDDGRSSPAWSAEPDAVTARVVRHPTTGAIFVAVQGRAGAGCGEPTANLWGLYRVVDRTLVQVQLRALSPEDQFDTLIDVDNDGHFELLGAPGQLSREDGALIDQFVLPFYGCSC